MHSIEAFLKDLKQSVRMFAQSPAFTLAAVATLALGIGANTAIFSVVNAVLLRPVAIPDPDRLVIFVTTSPNGSGRATSPAKLQHYREQTSLFQDVSAFGNGIVNDTGGSFPEQLTSGQVSADFFRLSVRRRRSAGRFRRKRIGRVVRTSPSSTTASGPSASTAIRTSSASRSP